MGCAGEWVEGGREGRGVGWWGGRGVEYGTGDLRDGQRNW